MSDERMFPVLYGYAWEDRAELKAGAPRHVPWSMLAPHARQAMSNHHQTLERLAERGGLGLDEVCAVLEDRPWRRMTPGAALEKVRALIDAHTATQAPGVERTEK